MKMVEITDFSYTPIKSHKSEHEYVIDTDVTVSMAFSSDDDNGEHRVVTATAKAGTAIPKLAIPPVFGLLFRRWDNDYVSALCILQICIYAYSGNAVITRAVCDEIIGILLRNRLKTYPMKCIAYVMMDMCAGWFLPWGERNNDGRLDGLSLKITYSYDDVDCDDDDDDDDFNCENFYNNCNT